MLASFQRLQGHFRMSSRLCHHVDDLDLIIVKPFPEIGLVRYITLFGGSLRSVLEALEEQVVVLRLLAAQQEAGKVTVRIGHETEAAEMAGTSVVTTTYGSSGTVYGGMGVVGPTRMDYPGTMANVAAVAMYIGEVLGHRSG